MSKNIGSTGSFNGQKIRETLTVKKHREYRKQQWPGGKGNHNYFKKIGNMGSLNSWEVWKALPPKNIGSIGSRNGWEVWEALTVKKHKGWKA